MRTESMGFHFKKFHVSLPQEIQMAFPNFCTKDTLHLIPLRLNLSPRELLFMDLYAIFSSFRIFYFFGFGSFIRKVMGVKERNGLKKKYAYAQNARHMKSGGHTPQSHHITRIRLFVLHVYISLCLCWSSLHSFYWAVFFYYYSSY